MSEVEVDPEANFFDNHRNNGVNRATYVREITAEEATKLQKMKSDQCSVFFFEMILWCLVLIIICQDTQGSDVQQYLLWLMTTNTICAFLKIFLINFMPDRANFNIIEYTMLGSQFLQSFLNTIFFIMSYTYFDEEDSSDIQAWIWSTHEGDWLVNWIGIVLGLFQYYQLIMFGIFTIVIVIFGCAFLFCNTNLNNSNQANQEEEGGPHNVANRPENTYNRQSSSRMNRVLNLGKLSRIFDQQKFNEMEECVICLEDFKADDMVTPLPCDKRHYFHSKCIEEWSANHNDCPLCKKTFTVADLAGAAQRRTTVTQPISQEQSINDNENNDQQSLLLAN